MIALNKLVENVEKYKKYYQAKGKIYDLNFFVKEAENLKFYEQKSANLRSQCNKLCSKVLIYRENKPELKNLMKQIKELDKQSKQAEKQAKIIEKTINKKLEKLDNLPDYICDNDEVIYDCSNLSTAISIKKILLTIFNPIYDELSPNKYLLACSNRLYQESELPILIEHQNDTFQLLAPEDKIDKYLDSLLKILSTTTQQVIKVKTKSLARSSCSEYISKLNNSESIKLQLNRDYNTRKFKIKYHQISTDSTKFVNELILKITKKR